MTRFFLRILKSLNEGRKLLLDSSALVDFSTMTWPATLAYWLLEYFEHLQCSLKLPNGVEVVADTKDVELIFGIQNGGITFDQCDRATDIKYMETIPLEEEDIYSM